MDTTYLYTKRFIDQEVRRLGQPLEITPSLERILADQNNDDSIEGGELSEKQLHQIIGKVNVLIKRHNRNIFPKQVVNQIVQQVIKCEQNKLMIVNDKLMRVELILKPILLPEVNQMGNVKMLMGEFGTLVRELPESKYLFEEEDETGDEDDNAPDHEESEEDNILVQDEEEQVNDEELTKSQYTRQLKQRTVKEHLKQHDDRMLQQYDEIRQQLIQLHLGLEYKYAKLEYLTQLKQKLLLVLHVPIPQPVPDTMGNDVDDEPYDSDDEVKAIHSSNQVDTTSNTSLPNEINKFRVLVEKIAYRLKSKDELQAALDSIAR